MKYLTRSPVYGKYDVVGPEEPGVTPTASDNGYSKEISEPSEATQTNEVVHRKRKEKQIQIRKWHVWANNLPHSAGLGTATLTLLIPLTKVR